MYIDPGSDIYLFQGVPLDNTYDNTIYFSTPTQQIEFFTNSVLYQPRHFTNQTYQRLERGYMRLKVAADSITGCNYCAFRNTRYSSKLWYAFINSIEWINNEVAEPGTIPVWKQPTGSQDAYNKGDKVHYPDADGPVYVSTVDANVWEPGVYGWEEE